jgi:hypothetical protein
MIQCGMSNCYSCRTELPREKVFRSTVCPGCGKGVRVCLNCRFYSPGSHWDCRETISELVRDKDLVNFCDFYSTAQESPAKGSDQAGADRTPGTRSDFDNLFDG